MESVLDVPRNLRLKFCQNRFSNSWDITDIEFSGGGWWVCKVIFVSNPTLGYVRLNWGWVGNLTISNLFCTVTNLGQENNLSKSFGSQIFLIQQNFGSTKFLNLKNLDRKTLAISIINKSTAKHTINTKALWKSPI